MLLIDLLPYLGWIIASGCHLAAASEARRGPGTAAARAPHEAGERTR